MLRLYRMALLLYPPAFRREYAADMLLDAADARAEAAADSRRDGLWRWRLHIALDLVCTFSVQWLRTGLPLIAIVAAAIPLAMTAGLASIARRVRFEIPADAPRIRGLEQHGILAGGCRTDLPETRDVVEYPETPAVGRNREVIVFDDEIPH